MSATEGRPPFPPFTLESATQKVRLAEDGWNTRDAARVAMAYTADTQWRNRAEFANGHVEEAGALIGADGNASAVRSFLFPGEPAVFNGQVAFRALIPDALVPDSVRRVGLGMHPAPKRYLLHYPLRGGAIMNLIGCGQATAWEEEVFERPEHAPIAYVHAPPLAVANA